MRNRLGLQPIKRSQHSPFSRPLSDFLPGWQGRQITLRWSQLHSNRMLRTQFTPQKGGIVSTRISSNRILDSVIGVSSWNRNLGALYISISSSTWVGILRPVLILVRYSHGKRGSRRIIAQHHLTSDNCGRICASRQSVTVSDEQGLSLLENLPSTLPDTWLSICQKDSLRGHIICEAGDCGGLLAVGQEVALSAHILRGVQKLSERELSPLLVR